MKSAIGSATTLRADARNLPIPDNSVDLVVTSPPFLNLRSYTDGGQHYDGQIGASTRDQYLEDLWQVTAECVRVLKPTGSMFVELGDSYTNKSLNLSPHRYAIGCVDRLGLILRAEICWSRPNGLPESVTDRVRRSHSVLFHLVMTPRYFSAVDTIREPHAQRTHDQAAIDARRAARESWRAHRRNEFDASGDRRAAQTPPPDPLGKLPGSVWEIATEPLRVPDHLPQHFAAYPTELPRRIILGWSPSGVCTACGEGRRPVAAVSARTEPTTRRGRILDAELGRVPGWRFADGPNPPTRTITGEACACPDTSAPTTPATVLDPFGGTGTTALVAKALGRRGISVDMSADYCRLATWRTNDPGELAKAMRVEKPPKQLDGQADLFEAIA
jgi:DNA modification methylase